MTTVEYKKKLEELQNEIENLKVKLNEVQDEEIPEYPTFNNDVMFVMSSGLGVLGSGRRTCSGQTGDYNSFHTKEYAEVFATKCRELAMLLHCKWYVDRELVTDFSDDSAEKWCVWYDHYSNKWTVDCQRLYENTAIYFTTAEVARKAAEWMNKYAKKNNERTTN